MTLENLLFLLTSFRGRISRKSWWIGTAIWSVAELCARWLLRPEISTFGKRPPLSWPDTIWQLAWIIPAAALATKRFNDRDRPAWTAFVFVAIAVAFRVAPHFGFAIPPSVPGMGLILFWTFAIVALLMFIDNGFIRGTDGPNRYGPDPLASETATA